MWRLVKQYRLEASWLLLLLVLMLLIPKKTQAILPPEWGRSPMEVPADCDPDIPWDCIIQGP